MEQRPEGQDSTAGPASQPRFKSCEHRAIHRLPAGGIRSLRNFVTAQSQQPIVDGQPRPPYDYLARVELAPQRGHPQLFESAIGSHIKHRDSRAMGVGYDNKPLPVSWSTERTSTP